MARNEEKQLARLNRFYLYQQKEEQAKKRPPRPRLDTLHSVDEIKKWLPTILRDIEFYVKQMEVPCYPQRQIDEFSQRLDRLRGEYKAFVHKLRSLEPSLSCTPWTDRPYEGKRRKEAGPQELAETSSDTVPTTTTREKTEIPSQEKFVPLNLPVLEKAKFYDRCFGYQKPVVPLHSNVDEDLHNEPLALNILTETQESSSERLAEPVDQDQPLSFNFKSQFSTSEMNDSSINLDQARLESNSRFHNANIRDSSNSEFSPVTRTKCGRTAGLASASENDEETNRLNSALQNRSSKSEKTKDLSDCNKKQGDKDATTSTRDKRNLSVDSACGPEPTCQQSLLIPYSDSSSSGEDEGV